MALPTVVVVATEMETIERDFHPWNEGSFVQKFMGKKVAMKVSI